MDPFTGGKISPMTGVSEKVFKFKGQTKGGSLEKRMSPEEGFSIYDLEITSLQHLNSQDSLAVTGLGGK